MAVREFGLHAALQLEDSLGSTLKQGPHPSRGGDKLDSLQEKKHNNNLEMSESVRVAGRFCPAAPTMCANLSDMAAFVFR